MLTGIVLSQADGRPMYLQIMEQIRRLVAVGEWKAAQPLPSIRQLAVDLNISVITVKRAYLELEREGIIATQHGKGSVVAAAPDVSTRIYEPELARHLEDAARVAALLGLSPRELQRRLRDVTDRIADIMKEST
jgi:GntR family transcriptional regulator